MISKNGITMSDISQECIVKSKEVCNVLNDFINTDNLSNIIPSPVSNRYRNRINFAIGYDSTSKITIGPLQSNKTVLPAETILSSSQISIDICKFIEIWISTKSLFNPVKYQKSLTGLWRHLTIYNTKLNQIMIVFHLQNMSTMKELGENEVVKIFNNISQFLETTDFKLISGYYQNSDSMLETRNYHPYYHIFGDKCIYEQLDNHLFSISPGSFFQVNSFTAEIIYNKILEISTLSKDKVVLDLCCGTGTIGIFLAEYCYKVYGIDCSESSIIDAKENAKLNNMTNTHYFCDYVEKKIIDILALEDLANKEIIVIVNPPRRGLYPAVLNAIYQCSRISQIIYLSCNLVSLSRDLKLLNIKSENIKNIIPINQFPHTKHCEILVNFIT